MVEARTSAPEKNIALGKKTLGLIDTEGQTETIVSKFFVSRENPNHRICILTFKGSKITPFIYVGHSRVDYPFAAIQECNNAQVNDPDSHQPNSTPKVFILSQSGQGYKTEEEARQNTLINLTDEDRGKVNTILVKIEKGQFVPLA